MEPSEWTLVMDRLEQLEKQNHRMKQLGAEALLLLGSVFPMAQAAPKKTVEANEFILKNGVGRTQATLSTLDPSGAILSFQDTNGKQRMAVGLTAADAPDIEMYDAQGVHIITLIASPHEVECWWQERRWACCAQNRCCGSFTGTL